jgi:RNA polymerase sigma-70 factor (ECF subfamily)
MNIEIIRPFHFCPDGYTHVHVADILWMSLRGQGGTSMMILNDDSHALKKLREFDPQTVGSIYDQYFPEVYRYVRYRINDDTIAEDIASEVFVRLLEAMRKGQGPQSSLKGWLIATASNMVNDHLRRQYRRHTEELSDVLPDNEPGVPMQVDEREETRVVKAAFARLTSEQQHVLALRFGLGFSLEETAAQMKKNANAIKALQFRALTSLQRQVREAAYE